MSALTGRVARSVGTVTLTVLLGSCVHFNAVYNARRLYDQAEKERLAGRGRTVAESYGEVIRKARRGFEADEDGTWSDDALFLIGRAHLRRMELTQARDVLREAVRLADNEGLRAAAILYQGAVAVAAREPSRGLELLADLEGVGESRFRAEGYLWRARARLQTGDVAEAWRDLNRAGEAHADFRPPANLERLNWGFELGDTATAFVGLQGLMRDSGARALGDSVRGTITRISEAWGPATAVGLMSGAQDAAWSRYERDLLLLLRARLAHQAQDTILAHEDAERVAGGVGEAAAAARLQLAAWRLAGVTQLGDLPPIRSLLLPIVEVARARDLLNAMLRVDYLVDAALVEERVGFFGAAEIALNVLGSRELASSLYLAYADADAGSPWAHKAILAALDAAGPGARRLSIKQRLDGLPETPYVRYARTGVAAKELAPLEERLQSTLNDLFGRVERELRARRLLILDPNDSGGGTSVPE